MLIDKDRIPVGIHGDETCWARRRFTVFDMEETLQ